MSHILWRSSSLYRCRLVRLLPYACSPAIEGSVLTVDVRECIVVFGSVSAPRPILRVDSPSVPCCLLAAESTAYVCRFWWLSFLLVPSLGRTVELCLEWSLLHGSWSWLLSCDAMTDVVILQTVVVVRLSVHVHLNLGLSPRDS